MHQVRKAALQYHMGYGQTLPTFGGSISTWTECAMLKTGAKVYCRKVGHSLRYAVSGYAPNGSDVADVIAANEAL